MNYLEFGNAPPMATGAGNCKFCGEEMVNHIRKEGARFHVFSYHLVIDDAGKKHGITLCSDKKCVTNHGIGKCVPWGFKRMKPEGGTS